MRMVIFSNSDIEMLHTLVPDSKIKAFSYGHASLQADTRDGWLSVLLWMLSWIRHIWELAEKEH